jgi:Kef-type K+ transport system membrane component KefB
VIRRIFTLVVVGVLVALLVRFPGLAPEHREAEATILLGFALLAACLLGEIVEQLRLPRITGYMLAGIAFGPFLLGFLDTGTIERFGIFNDMAYAFIGLAAGAELRLSVIRGRLKSIVLLITCTTLVVMLGVGASFFLSARWFAPIGKSPPLQLLAVAAVVGAIATARSPSSAIAIINETRAQGPFTETILGVTVAVDVVVIIVYSVTIAAVDILLGAAGGFDAHFLFSLALEIGISLVLGLLVGLAVALYIKREGPQLGVAIVAACFLVYRFSLAIDHFLAARYEVALHLEPLLICAAAGFAVQNLSAQGERLLAAMEWASLPVYVLFFTLAGANLDLRALAAAWALALSIAASRALMMFLGSALSARLAGDPPAFRRHAWLGFVTQAGLSLALVSQVADSYPAWGGEVATILVAVIAINQIVGPVAFKHALERVGETRAMRYARQKANSG